MTTYNYIELADEFGVCERTIYRWLATMKAEAPDETLVIADGKHRKVTQEGYLRLAQISEEIRAGIREDDNSAITPYLQPDLTEAPNFQAPRNALTDLATALASRGEQLGYKLGYEATFYGVGKGIAKGQEQAVKKLKEEAQL